MINSGDTIRRSDAGLLSTIGWTDAAGSPTYCLEGSLFNAGTVQWLRDGLRIIDQADEVNGLALSVPNAGGVMLVPAFTGWDAPLGSDGPWRAGRAHPGQQPGPHCKGSPGGNRPLGGHLGGAAEAAIGHGLGELAVDGGAAASDPLLQAQADSTGLTVRRPSNLESTARGVALFAGVQAGVVSGLQALASLRHDGAQRFEPQIDSEQRRRWRERWDDAVNRSLGWHG